jgi:DNA-binding LytR/AlgR family response regulator
MWGLILSWPFFSMFLMVLFICIAVDPYVFPNMIAVEARIAFWSIGIVAYILTTYLFFQIAQFAASLLNFDYFFSPIVGVPSIVIVTIFASYLGAFFDDTVDTHLKLDLAAFVRNYLLTQGLEFSVFNWLGGELRERSNAAAAVKLNSGDDAKSYLVVGGQKIPKDQIILIEARQHYVHIHVAQRELVLRSTMKTLMAQLEDSDGCQVHRSHWVARTTLHSLSGQSGKKVAVLSNGETRPISRSREKIVANWFAEHGPL